jgi:hypothetical protein
MQKIVAQICIAIFSLASILLALRFYPLLNAYDEIQHVRMIEFFQEEKRLPILPEDWPKTDWEAHQAPLYYVLFAIFSEVALPDVATWQHYNTYPFRIEENYHPDLVPYNRQMYTQTWADPEAEPYIFSLRVLRFASLLMNIIGLLFLWRASRLVFRPEAVSWGTLLFLGMFILTPAFWRNAIGISNTRLLFLLSGLYFWLMAKVYHQGLRWRWSVLLGFCLGLGLLTKIYMFPLTLLTGFGFIIFGRGDWRRIISHLALVAALTFVLAGWWYLRNYSLYQEFTGAAPSEAYLGSRRTVLITPWEAFTIFSDWLPQHWLESWSVLNQRLHFLLARGISLTLQIAVLAFVPLWVGRRLLYRGLPLFFLVAYALGLGFALVGAMRNLHGMWSAPISTAVHPAFHLLVAACLLSIVPSRWWGRFSLTLLLLIGLVSVLFQAKAIAPLYPAKQIYTSVEAAHISNPTNIVFENGMHLLGYELETAVLRPREQTWVRLCWQTDRPLNQDYAFTLKFVLPDLPFAAAQDGYHLSGRYPTSTWTVGEIFCERVILRVKAEALAPRAYGVLVGLYVYQGATIPYLSTTGEKSDYLILDRVTVAQKAPRPQSFIAASTLGLLRDYQVTVEGELLNLTLHWWTQGSSLHPYHYFLHALDAQGELVAQLDAPPLANTYPTTHWIEASSFEETLYLALPPGTQQVILGLYDSLSGTRLTWDNGATHLEVYRQP